MAFTGQDVVALRTKTGAGMMDCKKALEATDGNMDKAVDYLREKGMASAAKKASRIASQGIVDSYINLDEKLDEKSGVLLEVNCETDFVAKSDDFKKLVQSLAEHITKAKPLYLTKEEVPTNISKDYKAICLLEQDYVGDSSKTITGLVNEAIGKIGEKIMIRRFVRFAINDGDVVDSYIHLGGKVGVLLEINCATKVVAKSQDIKDLVHNIAMHIAAAKPLYLTKEEIPAAVIEKEKDIYRVQALNEPKPKPANIIEKMIEGRVTKYYKEVCLLEQEYVRDPAKTITGLVNEAIGKIGEKITVRRFVRFEMGEGIEKKKDTFADEIQNQLNQMQK
ncbi:MAG: translation elongation factor Ts [Clostridiales bacterium]|jgi:elongation factor Ts|nr:translation elongation factor Ts [Clostridiales bacterium]